MATTEFSKFADILSAALSQQHLLGFIILGCITVDFFYLNVCILLKVIEKNFFNFS